MYILREKSDLSLNIQNLVNQKKKMLKTSQLFKQKLKHLNFFKLTLLDLKPFKLSQYELNLF